MQYGGKFSLLDAVNYYKKQGMTNSAVSGMEEALVMFFVVELLKMLKALHSSAVVHTDIRMENILLRFPSPSANKIPWEKQYDDSDDAWKQRGLLLIDFGRGIQSGLLDSSISHLKLLNPFPSHKGKEDIFEKRLEVPWSWDVDLVGVAAIIYCLIFSEPLYYKGKEALSSNNDLNTQWNGETWFNAIKDKRFQRSWLKDEFWLPLFELLLIKYSSVSAEDYQTQSDFAKKSFRFNGDQKVQHLQDLDKFEQIAKGYLREWTSKSSGVCLKTLLRKLEINLLNK
jgi:checkpoint serine/threonine-protein kinase